MILIMSRNRGRIMNLFTSIFKLKEENKWKIEKPRNDACVAFGIDNKLSFRKFVCPSFRLI